MRREAVPAGLRRALVGSAFVHVLVVVAVVVVGGQAGRTAARPERVLVTKLVRLGTPRPAELLPRKAPPPAPPSAQPVPTPAPGPSSPKPAPKQTAPAQPSAKDRIAAMRRVASALDRLKEKASAEGQPDGSPDGEVSDLSRAIVGNKYATEVHRCLKAHYAIEGVAPSRVAGRNATVWLRIAPNGTFIETKIEKGSGLPLFDRAVERAVKRCGKVSPPDSAIREQVRKDGIEVFFQP